MSFKDDFKKGVNEGRQYSVANPVKGMVITAIIVIVLSLVVLFFMSL